MSQIVTVGNNSYVLPDNGDPIGWGAETTAFLVALANQLASISQANDIPLTQTAILNGASGEVLLGAALNSSLVRAADFSYSVYRASGSVDAVQSGSLLLSYQDEAAASGKWIMSHLSTGDAGVTFYVSDDGQISYDSSDTGLTGSIVFKAVTLPKTV